MTENPRSRIEQATAMIVWRCTTRIAAATANGWRCRAGPMMSSRDTPGDVTAAGPQLGADNETVFREFLGMTDDEYAACRSQGAFE